MSADTIPVDRGEWALAVTDRDRYKRQRDEARARADSFQGCAESLREALKIVLDSEKWCEACEGSGGMPLYRRVDTLIGQEPDCVVSGHADPNSDPCDECFGTGFSWPSAAYLWKMVHDIEEPTG